MNAQAEQANRRMLRARDAMDRRYAEPLDVSALAAIAHLSEAHFAREFARIFGETPGRYLQRRRVERAMFLLRHTTEPITSICMDVGFASLGSFSSTFRDIVGCSPREFRERVRTEPEQKAPTSFAMRWSRPADFRGVPGTDPRGSTGTPWQDSSPGEAPGSQPP